MNVLITGSDGFIGKNLSLRLSEIKGITAFNFSRQQNEQELSALLQDVDFVFHLAGINRPLNPEEFTTGNINLTQSVCSCIADIFEKTGRMIPVLLTSSIHAVLETPYGNSKREAENVLLRLNNKYGIPIYICRLPGVFGKWAKPNYNSVVATFCHNIANDKPIEIADKHHPLKLVHIDDVLTTFISILDRKNVNPLRDVLLEIQPEYHTTVGELADTIKSFADSRENLVTERVGNGFLRALYSTYVSYLPVDKFTYSIKEHKDPRGRFVEIIKTIDSGQVSYFTAHPGVTRGGHYHHCKTEKFLVIQGTAKFRFRHLLTNERYELVTSKAQACIVETIPGWSHDVTNIGDEELIAIVWANENFDAQNPDTTASLL
ncbi:UDP-2-acetamido-2,6-beta-L-arabino-hexul-4-ose reductase [Pantoea trifolii]|uniref:NAD-dependent epimerase/dehydratase family protein n=1 Tax=Pantoea trifolii TaxID=2968030 RepID=A0ABT1VLP3_9GAMM|nr:NAD-dependent epimerase/dehydratase family protein [Pantoea sp. MMK2]MCQ8236467.1 NAD-dependent epimerase/dehydratase family protein [Pantoea sp. MMK3]